jgi:hypothetical protein
VKILQNVPAALAILVAVAALGFVASQVLDASTEHDGPVDVVWDREVCAHCRMHIGDPAFAAQIQTADGAVLSFDDAGCAFELVAAAELTVRATWFRHHAADRWLGEDEVAFVEVAQSPMGYGFAATDADTPGSLPLAEVRRRVLERRDGR